MRQYKAIKERNPDSILLFRMGDFYETFDEDARIVSGILGITLTKRSNGKAANVDLAGFPHHSIDKHLPRLVKAGKRVAICEQLEDPKATKSIVKRDVVEIVTPGVSFRDQLLSPKQSNYLVCVVFADSKKNDLAGVSFVDASTGEFQVLECDFSMLQDLLQSLNPAELLFDKRDREKMSSIRIDGAVLSGQDDWCFAFDYAYETLLKHFKTHSLKGFGIEEMHQGIRAAGVVMHYLGETQKTRLGHIQRIFAYDPGDYILLDPQTKRNLELVSNQAGQAEGSLISVVDETLTPMGGRMLRSWLLRPLKKRKAIENRLEAVGEFISKTKKRNELRSYLQHIGDLERLVARICLGKSSPRDVHHLKLSLQQIPAVKNSLSEFTEHIPRSVREGLSPCQHVVDMIDEIVVDEPPASLLTGAVVKTGYSAELDELRGISKNAKDWMAKLQAEESERTGITSLKIGYNRVFGYYLEVTNAHKDKVPDDYIRKQTLVNAERYITPGLKEYEEKILTADERSSQLENEIFDKLKANIARSVAELLENARYISQIDVISSFAELAQKRSYFRPEMVDEPKLELKEARHPVVEALLPAGEPFIPNDILLDSEYKQVLVITGPNMAGKSVVLRQTSLIALLAHVGSYVPASKAIIGIVDRIFTRVGASDNLLAGESTFLVEMNETANILNNASNQSLILFDEVGRGTSTFDGISIAWSIIEYLHEFPGVRARTLFATHYHELNALAERYDRVHNARIQVKEHNGKLIFLRKLVSGGSDHSYGIDVARMAGLPSAVINRARQILKLLESQQLSFDESLSQTTQGNRPVIPKSKATAPLRDLPEMQMTLFAQDPLVADLLDHLRAVDPNAMTPMEALMKIVELKKIVED